MAETDLHEKANELYATLSKSYPEADIELVFSTPLELTVATVLSAQCTDKKVNAVTRQLFDKYRTPQDYLNASVDELEQDIRPTGFYRQKAKHIRAIAEALIADHGGKVPRDLDALTDLPGIGRKTANVILGNAFGTPGIVVDTHVKRVSLRLGLTTAKTPEKIEQDLMEFFPEEEWVNLSHVLIFHGRYTCTARSPHCDACPVSALCDYYQQQTDS